MRTGGRPEPMVGPGFEPVRLTPEEQRELGRRYVRSRTRETSARTPAAKAKAAAETKEIADKIVRMMTPVIVRESGRYSRAVRGSQEDIFAECALAVLEGLRSYDPGKGALMTHLWHYVRNGCNDYVRYQHGTIRTPGYIHDMRSKIERGTPLESFGRGKRRCYADALAAKTVAVGCGGEGDNPYSLTLDEVAAPEPVPELDRRSMLAAIRLDKLDVKSRRIVVLRLGLDPDEPGPMTLREIGERLGITRERARQIEKRAMMTLRLHAGEPRPERSVQV